MNDSTLTDTPSPIHHLLASPVFSTISTDSDGFATVILKDTSEPAIRFDETQLIQPSDEEESQRESDEDEDDADHIWERATAINDNDEDDEFPSLNEFASTTTSVSTHVKRFQIGGQFDEDSSSDEDQDDDDDDEPQVTVETLASITSDTSAIRNRIMQHDSERVTLDSSTRHSIDSASSTTSFNTTTSAMTSHERELILLRSMLQSDMSGSLARMRERAAQQLSEVKQELNHFSFQQIQMDDLLGLIPQSNEEEKKQIHANVNRAIPVTIQQAAPFQSQPRVQQQHQQPIQRVIRMAEEDDAYLEEAAMMAAEMSDTDHEEDALEFSNLGSISPQAIANEQSQHSSPVISPSASRSSAYASSSSANTTSNSHPSSASSTSTSSVLPPSSISVSVASKRRGPPPGVPSAHSARQGVFLPEDMSTSSSSTAATAAASSRALPSSASSSASNLPASLFASEALSFLKFTPESTRKLQAQFAKEQATFRQRIEHTSAPDATIHVIGQFT